jgi:hypothetical protein
MIQAGRSRVRFPMSLDFSFDLILLAADHSGSAVTGVKCFRSLEHWDRGFESHSKYGCLSAFILFVLPCAGSGLAMG